MISFIKEFSKGEAICGNCLFHLFLPSAASETILNVMLDSKSYRTASDTKLPKQSSTVD
jgi:hypothetical protein